MKIIPYSEQSVCSCGSCLSFKIIITLNGSLKSLQERKVLSFEGVLEQGTK